MLETWRSDGSDNLSLPLSLLLFLWCRRSFPQSSCDGSKNAQVTGFLWASPPHFRCHSPRAGPRRGGDVITPSHAFLIIFLFTLKSLRFVSCCSFQVQLRMTWGRCFFPLFHSTFFFSWNELRIKAADNEVKDSHFERKEENEANEELNHSLSSLHTHSPVTYSHLLICLRLTGVVCK